MSLRKSPTLTPALLAANRRNAKKSTGPRTAQGKAWSRMNRLTHGNYSDEYRNFVMAMVVCAPGRMRYVIHSVLGSKLAIHPLFRDAANIHLRAEYGPGEEPYSALVWSEKRGAFF